MRCPLTRLPVLILIAALPGAQAALPPGADPPPRVTSPVQAPLFITVETSLPALVNGQRTTVPDVQTLTLPAERASILRARGVMTPSLDADLTAFLKGLAVGRDARFEELPGGWAVVQRNGLKVDVEQTRANVLAALNDPRGVTANVAVTGQTVPKRTLEFFSKRGVTAHLGTGETGYQGSSRDRMTNIHVGTRFFQDRLIEDKTFSFNRAIGPITRKAGYVPGLIIAGDRTESGLGGGICQVSTTVFRALYQAGLPVTERHSHSYQVHYYGDPGLDAAIYQPSLDLKFANSTGGALWFQADWDDDAARLVVSVFGRPQAYTVEIGAPRVLRHVPAPADRLITSAGVKAGERQQVEWAAPGGTTAVTRTVRGGGRILRQDTLKSSYRPWANVFLVSR